MARKTKPLTDTEIKVAKSKDAEYLLYDTGKTLKRWPVFVDHFIFGRGGENLFGKRTDQPGIDTGKFINLITHTLKIIVISRVFSCRTDIADRGKPGLPVFSLCPQVASIWVLSLSGFTLSVDRQPSTNPSAIQNVTRLMP